MHVWTVFFVCLFEFWKKSRKALVIFSNFLACFDILRAGYLNDSTSTDVLRSSLTREELKLQPQTHRGFQREKSFFLSKNIFLALEYNFFSSRAKVECLTSLELEWSNEPALSISKQASQWPTPLFILSGQPHSSKNSRFCMQKKNHWCYSCFRSKKNIPIIL